MSDLFFQSKNCLCKDLFTSSNEIYKLCSIFSLDLTHLPSFFYWKTSLRSDGAPIYFSSPKFFNTKVWPYGNPF